MNESFKFLPVTMVRNLQVPNPPSGQLCSRNFDDDHSLHYLVYNNRIVQTTERCFGGYDGSNAQNINGQVSASQPLDKLWQLFYALFV